MSPIVIVLVGPCSRMLNTKNKATQLLMIRDLRPSDEDHEGHTFIILVSKNVNEDVYNTKEI
jgi:hypothetical protein